MEAQQPWWQRPSAIALVLANLAPLAGVLFGGWQVFPLLLLFWLENLVIGLYTIARMLLAQGGTDIGKSAPALLLLDNLLPCLFFVVHYGGFASGHGMFLVFMFGNDELGQDADFNPFNPAGLVRLASDVVLQYGLWWALAALLSSHGISFYLNYFRPRLYETAIAGELMMQPYKRVFVLHVAILLGGFAATQLGAPLPALLLLLALKIGVDLASHLHEHRRMPMPVADGRNADSPPTDPEV